MNPKIATLIAIETGILIGMISWLGYSRYSSEEPDLIEQESHSLPASKVAAPAFEASNPPAYPSRYEAERKRARLVAEQAVPVPNYYQPVYQAAVAQPYVQPAAFDDSGTTNSPIYSDVSEEAAVPEYVAPPTVIYYAQPVQTVIFNQPRGRNRCRSLDSPSNGDPLRRHCPDRRNFQQNPRASEPHPNVVVSPPAAPPPQDEIARPRANTVRPGTIVNSPRRPTLPLSSAKSLRTSYLTP